jgi:hypothetical protein
MIPPVSPAKKRNAAKHATDNLVGMYICQTIFSRNEMLALLGVP